MVRAGTASAGTASAGGKDVDTFDVVVVGAGPAGSQAARVAARGGARVCVLERAEVPRYKTCGGGLVGMSRDHADIDLAPLVRSRVDAITFTADGRYPVTRRRSDGGPLLEMVMRADFDAALLSAAVAAGAQVRTGAHVVALREDPAGEAPGDEPFADADGFVTVSVRGGRDVRARVVVGADGSSGRIGGYVGVRCDQVDVGLEGEYPASAELARSWSGRLLLDWGPVPGSYGWLFPKGDLLSVGVIGDRSHGDALRAYYRRVVSRLGLDGVEPVRDSGHLTRVRAPDSPLARGRVLVAGDAAGLLDPWTREGISFALRSGRLAGAAAAKAARRDLASLADYPRQVEAVFGAELDAGRALLAAFAGSRSAMHLTLATPPAFRLFTRIVDGRSTAARQLRRPGVRRAIAALAR